MRRAVVAIVVVGLIGAGTFGLGYLVGRRVPPGPSVIASASPTTVVVPSTAPASSRPFAIWPEDTRREAMRAAVRLANGEDPWRSDAVATAQEFARTILGWPGATTNAYEGSMACNRCLVVGREDGQANVIVDLRQLVDGKWWSVTWVGSKRDDAVGMMIRGPMVSMSFDRRGAASVEVTVGYGGRNVTRTSPRGEVVKFDLGFQPSTPGHFLILFKDEQGRVFSGQGAALRNGDFAAG